MNNSHTAPTRLKDDATFLAQTGLAAPDLAAPTHAFDVVTARARLLTALAAPLPWHKALLRAIGGPLGFGVLVLAAIALWWSLTHDVTAPEPTPLEASIAAATDDTAAPVEHAIELAVNAAAPAAEMPAPTVTSSNARTRLHTSSRTVSGTVARAHSQVALAPTPPLTAAEPTALAPVAAAAEVMTSRAPSGLADELAVLERAHVALRAGDLDEAADALAAHERDHGEGVLAVEARLDALELALRRHDVDTVATLAPTLLHDARTQGRAAEIERACVEALVAAHRCAQAAALHVHDADAKALVTTCVAPSVATPE
jgi:hypothetical protein